tara:strand:+ start:1025 stop:2563 length:1539 start_codon:yes stop_codon:yes gene_type:complete
VSSRALASALFGYGADIKVKNIVMEIFFSILPPVYMNQYKIISPTDELVVDLFFQYVKQTLVEREELATISQALVSETFPDIRFDELSDTEVRLLSDVAIKRTVFQAVKKLSERLYNPTPNVAELNDFDKDITKKDFVQDTINKFFLMEKTGKLSFLNEEGKIKTWEKIKAGKDEKKFYRVPQPETGIVNADDFGGVVSVYAEPKFCFEPYVRVSVKGFTDIRNCSSDLGLSPTTVATVSQAIVKMVFALADGNESPTLKNKFEADIAQIALRTFVCSVEDFQNYFSRVLFPELGEKLPNLNITEFREILDAHIKSISLGVRSSIDAVRQSPVDFNSPDLIKVFPEKSIFYEEPYIKESYNAFSEKPSTIFPRYPHVTYVLAAAEVDYKASEGYLKVVSEGKKFNDIKLDDVFKLSATPTDASVAELLLIDLMKTKDFDAIVKSVFVPAFLFNTINVIPNVEIAKQVIPIMRKNGVFKGIDDGINELFSSLSAYLSGDFPWLRDCGDLARLL